MWQKLDRTLKILTSGLDASTLRHKVLANNVANVDTPNFQRQDVNFYSQLKSMMGDSAHMATLELQKTDFRHLNAEPNSSGAYQVQQTSGQVREDGNNVNIDAENAKIAENNIYYSTLASVVIKKYQAIDRIIRGGER